MMKKKAKKSKAAVKKVGKKKRAAKGKKAERTPGEVRKELAKMVIAEAEEITNAIIGQSKAGQFAPAKYVLEMAHVYPEVNDGSEATENEDCLAKTLLKRLNIPETPVVADHDEDEDFVTIPPRAKNTEVEAEAKPSVEEREEEEVPVG